MALISIQHLSLKNRLDDVSLSIERGEVVGIIGPNGAGKSTLIKMMAGLIEAERAKILVDDRDLSDLSPSQRGSLISWIPQHCESNWPISIRDTVELGTLVHRDLGAIDDALKTADLESLQHRRLDDLSGGELARVWFARAIAARPALLLADEPVAALDPRYQLYLLDQLKAQASPTCAVVLVLHDLQLAAQFCDRIVLLHHGQLVASGTPQDILQSSLLSRCFGVHFQSDFEQIPPLIRAIGSCHDA